jgi:hypothetical protein
VTHASDEIPCRALTPRAEEYANLWVPVGLSASHVTFCTLRVEPTWMATGQAAGAAAALAARSDVAVQDADVARLQATLVARGAVLDRESTAKAGD